MSEDLSYGYDALADTYVHRRSNIGARLVHDWARSTIPAGGSILDAGCGTGFPISAALLDAGFEVHAIDASERMIAIYQSRFPSIPTAVESVVDGALFARDFDAVLAIGVIFLLNEEDQSRAISNLASVLRPGGHLFFTAPTQTGDWIDHLTQRRSVSLGSDAYLAEIEKAGCEFVGCHVDSGDNNYYEARKRVRS